MRIFHEESHRNDVLGVASRLALRCQGKPYALLLALLITVVATVARAALAPVIPEGSLVFLTYYPAAALATFFCGTVSGLLAVVLSTAAALYFFIEPVHTFAITHRSVPLIAAFWLVSGVNILLIQALHQSQRKAKEQQDLIMGELNHRSKNLLAMITALAHRSLRNTPEGKEFMARLEAMSRADTRLTMTGRRHMSLEAVVNDALAPFYGVETDIPADIQLGSKASLNFSLLVHELATNAVKYGALRPDLEDTRVEVCARDDMSELVFTWRECGVPNVTNFSRSGFGFHLMKNLARSLKGEAVIDCTPDGILYRLRIPYADERNLT